MSCLSTRRVVVPGVCLAAIVVAAGSFAAEPGKGKKAPRAFDPIKQFDHLGIFTAEKKPDSRLVAASRVWVTDIEAHPYRVEWLRRDKPGKGPVRPNPHVAFRVDNIAAAFKELGVRSKPFDAGIAKVGFFQTDDGATIEFMEYYPTAAKSTATRKKEAAKPRLRFDHVGFIADDKKPGERFVPATKVWVTDIAAHPYRVEWLRFEPDSPVTGPVREMPHVAFRVDDIAEAAKGLKVLLEPFDAGIAKVGFYQTADGAVVEFMQYYEKAKVKKPSAPK